jgi:hypothetical protein
MLRQAENELIQYFRESPLSKFVRYIGPMPEMTDADLLRRLAAQVPAVYVDSSSFTLAGGYADLKFELLLLAGHARAVAVGKQGDGQALALHDFVDATLSIIDGRTTGDYSWNAVSVDFSRDKAYIGAGLIPAAITVRTQALVDTSLDETKLAEFRTFAADYDIPPFEDAAEHAKWLKEPADHTTSKPDLSDHLKLR